jgi:hypothetical protein
MKLVFLNQYNNQLQQVNEDKSAVIIQGYS